MIYPPTKRQPEPLVLVSLVRASAIYIWIAGLFGSAAGRVL